MSSTLESDSSVLGSNEYQFCSEPFLMPYFFLKNSVLHQRSFWGGWWRTSMIRTFLYWTNILWLCDRFTQCLIPMTRYVWDHSYFLNFWDSFIPQKSSFENLTQLFVQLPKWNISVGYIKCMLHCCIFHAIPFLLLFNCWRYYPRIPLMCACGLR